MLKIDDDVPVPAARNNQGITDALKKLRKGQSVFIHGKTAQDMGGFIDHCGLSGKVTRRTIDGGCRIWRIK
jgi:hypothetical protein